MLYGGQNEIKKNSKTIIRIKRREISGSKIT
jgi:hypothetical protein